MGKYRLKGKDLKALTKSLKAPSKSGEKKLKYTPLNAKQMLADDNDWDAKSSKFKKAMRD